MVAQGLAVLQLPTPFEVGRAVLSQGRYHFGIPDEGLQVQAYFPASNGPYFEATAPLVPKDVYVATLGDWLGYLADVGWSDEAVMAALRQTARWSRAAGLIALFGYLPVKLRIPALGGPVTFSPHGKIIVIGGWGGTSSTLVETFSFGMSYDVVGPDIGAMPNVLPGSTLEAIGDEWGAFIGKSGASGPNFSDEAWVTEVAYYRAQADGTSTTGTWQRYFLSPAVQGTNDGGNQPLQLALVTTLDAGGPRGGRFGRFYLPAPVLPLNFGVYSAASLLDLCNDIAATLDSINTHLSDAIAGDVELVVASSRGSGENRPVRSIRMGVVPDTQRRRRRALDEDYQVLPFQAV